MMNPFQEKARELADKRDRWWALEIARDWIADHYEPGQLVLSARHNGASAVPGHKEAMAIICERLMGRIDSRSGLVAMIDREMERMRAEAEGTISPSLYLDDGDEHDGEVIELQQLLPDELDGGTL